MAVKWMKVGKGLQATFHDSRKYGKRFDRYIRARYQVDKKFRMFSFGWESEWVAGEKARMQAEGDTGQRQSFLDYCQGELNRLKQNAAKGRGPSTPSEEKALAEKKAKAEAETKAMKEKEAVAFGDYFTETYLPGAKIDKDAKTYKAEKSYYNKWLKPNLAKMRLKDIRPIHIEKIKRVMIKDGRRPRTIQAILSEIRQVWNHARNNGVVSGDWPGRAVKVGRFDNRRLRFLSHNESERLLAELEGKSQQVHDMALLSLDTGMRAGEVFSLIWEHVKNDVGQIHVVDTKNGKNRTAYMTDRVRGMFERLQKGEGLVFPSNTGECIGQISKTFMLAVDELGLNQGVVDSRNRVTFHTCRHTFASNLVATGTNLYEVKELMGHSTLALTERYAHVRNENLEAAVKRMEKAEAEKDQAKVFELKG